MTSIKKVLPINELQVGMISSMDINFEDKILLTKGSIITEAIITKLKNNYIVDKLEVYLEDDFDVPLTLKMKSVKEIEDTFNEFSYNLANIFSSISMLKFPQLDEIRLFSKKIHEEFNLTGTVLRNVIFYGSGNDSIYRHSVNVTAISFILGKWLGLDESELNLLTYSSILHDFGKIKIDKSILNKRVTLTAQEYETFKTHPVIGYNFVKQIPYISPSISYAVLLHHEKIDGSGYPLHIKKNMIPKFAKIIAIADLFDEVSSNRYSKKIKGPFHALKVIQDESLTTLDFNYCNMFLNHLVNYYMGENVLLNNMRSCKIIKIQMDDITRPILLDDNGLLDLKKQKSLYVKEFIV